MNDNGRFSEAAAIALAGGDTVAAAAAKAGCGESTIYRLRQSSEFQQRVSELRTAAVERAVGQLAELATSAVNALSACLTSEDDGARIRAAVAILDRFAKLSESCDLRHRVEQLEAQQSKGLKIA